PPGRYVVLRIEPALLSRPFGLPSLTLVINMDCAAQRVSAHQTRRLQRPQAAPRQPPRNGALRHQKY
ncbi:hypothetical protein ACTZVT_27285, partial [Klebsiella pneumoniae]|uniref:hypothetical protein n=1 Tax=Klebsiella pneumoniae TaxID=573 RepID=UPI001C530BD7